MNYFWNAVSSSGSSFDLLLFLAASAMKATVLLGTVALLCLVVRRLSAATRHLLWTLALCAALLLPFLSIVEVWEVPVLPAQISSWGQGPANEPARQNDDTALVPEEGTLLRSMEAQPQIHESAPSVPDFHPATHSGEKALPPASAPAVEAVAQQGGATLLSKFVSWALAVWFAGALLLLCRLFIGLIATNSLTRGATEFKDPKLTGLFSSLLTELQLKGSVRLLRSERTLMPIVCGVLRPAVLLPASADEWPEERRRVVLLHELTHVTRKDCLTQMLAQTACAFYWFNPFVWHAARRLRVEREQACDDYVVSVGTKPSDYAHHLLEIARYLQERSAFQWSQTTTVAMARRSQLEGRLLAILSKEGKRRAMSQMMTAGVTALILAVFSLLAVVRPTTGSARGPRISETALNAETDAAENSTSGRSSATASGLKGDAVIDGAQPPQEPNEAGDNNAVEDEVAPEKVLDGAQAEQDLQAGPGSDVGSEAGPSTPPQLAALPSPDVKVELSMDVLPIIKANYGQERRPEAQEDKAGDFIDEMASAGYSNLTVDELIRLKSSGVTARYVRSLRALGLSNLTMKEVAGMSVNGVTPAFIEAIRNAGYKELTAKELMSFRVHGVTPEAIGKLRSAGYGNLTAKQLTDFAVHAVTPEFISSMRAVGLANLSPKELVTLRVHGITPEFVRSARKRLGDLTVKQIITLKIEGLIEGPGDE